MLIREHGFHEINGDGERIYITPGLISLMTTNSLAGGNMQASRPSKCKNGSFVYCIQNKWLRPRCHSQMALPLRKKIAEPVTRNNALAWRQPFCTTSGGTDRHREALALSWHRPDPRLGVVTDSQAGACQA